MVEVRKPYSRLSKGEGYVWFSASALAAVSLLAVAFVVIILANALGFYWPKHVARLERTDGTVLLGEIVERQAKTPDHVARLRLKIGNRDLYGNDFVWVDAQDIAKTSYPADAIALERQEYGNFYGFLTATGRDGEQNLQGKQKEVAEQVATLGSDQERLSDTNAKIEAIKTQIKKIKYNHRNGGEVAETLLPLQNHLRLLQVDYEKQQQNLLNVSQRVDSVQTAFKDISGQTLEIPNAHIVQFWFPNRMSTMERIGFYARKIISLLTDEPRESNTEGGLFPAIFGTIMMVLLMSLISIPFGVITAVYLHEYAKQGPFVKLVRISVNNLAGVPSIVYGVFGLGFFVYTLGSAIDQTFFAYKLPTPTFGTGGILWASLTLALLTVPVVIVSTEEALSAIPQSIREGSLGLGATKFQTLLRILLPMSLPGILTGLVLAMARAAGEVAPLMLTGAVKLAPQLPLDSHYPFFHLDRKFMHLGFHIYDLGFQSPNVEAVLPMVYVTTMLLLGIIIVLSAVAIIVRNRVRKRFSIGVF